MIDTWYQCYASRVKEKKVLPTHCKCQWVTTFSDLCMRCETPGAEVRDHLPIVWKSLQYLFLRNPIRRWSCTHSRVDDAVIRSHQEARQACDLLSTEDNAIMSLVTIRSRALTVKSWKETVKRGHMLFRLSLDMFSCMLLNQDRQED